MGKTGTLNSITDKFSVSQKHTAIIHKEITKTKVTHFSKIYYHKELQNSIINLIHTTEGGMATMLVLLIVGYYKI